MIVTVFAFALLLLAVPPETGETAKQQHFFAELQQADSLPKWVANVCFSEDDTRNRFLLMGGDYPVLRLRPYFSGVGGYTWPLRKQYGNEHEAAWRGRLVNDDTRRIASATFRINWDTGRYTLIVADRKESDVDTGICDGV